jgi:phosphoadenosine phosphosulfate reductase
MDGTKTAPSEVADTTTDAALLALLSTSYEALEPLAAARAAITWAFGQFQGDVVVASSFQDLVLIDLVRGIDAGAEVVFLDTGYHFAETLAFVEKISKTWELNLTIARPSVPLDEFACGTPNCCQVRKVEPLQRAIAGRKAWITGVKRVDTKERAAASILQWDESRQMVKVNPLVTWSEDDVTAYATDRNLPAHPLTYVGYLSIGCAPTTKPVEEGRDPREGRWPGSDKTECGLHI